MEVRLLNDGIGGYSNEELHEHGDSKRMVESQKAIPRPVVEVKK
jgi:hypothetical protein